MKVSLCLRFLPDVINNGCVLSAAGLACSAASGHSCPDQDAFCWLSFAQFPQLAFAFGTSTSGKGSGTLPLASCHSNLLTLIRLPLPSGSITDLHCQLPELMA